MNQEIKPVIDEGINLKCRFYENQYPKENDLVVVEVVEVQENASYVELLEYDRIRGMIPPNETTRALKGGIQKALKIGKIQVVRVLRVDEDQGYIDLSKKKVAKDEEQMSLQKFADGKMIHSIMRAIAEKCNLNIQELYKTIVWPLQENKLNVSVLQIFKNSLQDQKHLSKLNLPNQIQVKLMEEIERRLKPEPVTIKTEFDLISHDYAGCLIIKEALIAGTKKSTEECKLQFEIRASPSYTGRTTTISRDGVKIMKEALTEIENVMKKYQGIMKVKIEPKVVGDHQADFIDEVENEDGEDEYGITQQGGEEDDDDDLGMQ
ncbi:unnamed protein product [Paramecium sonneborni]|uniref:S1 motif domain-containing protein n=1 Tax=Paramecium sonneborni TaxID=65129 RepID=A0A8S1PPQ6_9CILI|nr:unnamed protein product [Paramecium sonneborni]